MPWYKEIKGIVIVGACLIGFSNDYVILGITLGVLLGVYILQDEDEE